VTNACGDENTKEIINVAETIALLERWRSIFNEGFSQIWVIGVVGFGKSRLTLELTKASQLSLLSLTSHNYLIEFLFYFVSLVIGIGMLMPFHLLFMLFITYYSLTSWFMFNKVLFLVFFYYPMCYQGSHVEICNIDWEPLISIHYYFFDLKSYNTMQLRIIFVAI
jgi:hypothetical protein